MGKQDTGKIMNRRDVLKLAGTAAAFCASFGFLEGGQAGGVVQHKNLQLKWDLAEIKWYSGKVVLDSVPVPARVLKYLQSDPAATVEIKLFRGGQLFRNLGVIQGKL